MTEQTVIEQSNSMVEEQFNASVVTKAILNPKTTVLEEEEKSELGDGNVAGEILIEDNLNEVTAGALGGSDDLQAHATEINPQPSKAIAEHQTIDHQERAEEAAGAAE